MSAARKESPTYAIETIGAYTIESLIGEGATSRVYRTARAGKACALKLMRKEGAEDFLSASLRFRKEAEALSRLDHPNLIKIIELGDHEGVPFVVMELVEGFELAHVLKNEGALSEDRTIQIARGLAGALSEVHRNGFVHRDIKPENVLIDSTGSPRLIDFGFALLDESASTEAVGTFKYAAPEQSSGDPKIDSRADLYALGVVIYECATGKAPYISTDVGELLRAHKTGEIPHLHESAPSCRETLSSIVAKLMAKKPGERYQTAEGLICDLDEIDLLETERKTSGKATLGQRDIRLGRMSEMPLLGRRLEMAALEEELAKSGPNKGVSILIEGEPGGGKSYLVKKFLERISQEASLPLVHLSGKCNLSEQTPLGPLREAIDSHLKRISTLDSSAREHHLEAIKKAAQGVEPSVRRLSQSLLTLLSDQEYDEAPKSQDAYFSALARFFCELARQNSRMVLCIDDVQWLDQASFGVLSQIQENLEEFPLIFLSTARNDENSQTALSKVLTSWGNKINRRLTLKPLSSEAVAEIVAVQLGGARLEDEVVTRLTTKANGNPFAIGQFIFAMLDSRILRKAGTGWLCDIAALDTLMVSTDVIQLIVARISHLSSEAIEVLSVAAAIGSKFEESLVEDVLGHQSLGTQQSLAQAIRANLIERSPHGGYAFVHDRILEALLSKFEADKLRDLHQKIAEVMDDGRPSDIYALAHHYSRGHVQRNPERVLDISLQAGSSALSGFSNQDAVTLFSFAEKVAEAHFETDKLATYLSLQENLATAHWRCGSGKVAISHCEKALTQAKTPLEKGRLHALMTSCYFNENQGALGWKESEKGLAALGTSFPRHPLLARISRSFHWLCYFALSLTGLGFGRARESDLERRRVLLSLYSPSLFASMIGLKWDVVEQIVPRMLAHLHALGSRSETAAGWGYFALFLGVKKRQKVCRKTVERAFELAEKSGDNQTIALVRSVAGWGLHWSGMLEEAEKWQKDSLLLYGKFMAPRWYIATANDLSGNNLVVRGHVREALTVTTLCLNRARATNNPSPIAATESIALGIHALLGNETELQKANANLRDLYSQLPEKSLDWCWYLANTLLVRLERAEPLDDLDNLIAKYDSLGVDPRTGPWFFKTIHLYAPLAYLRAYSRTIDPKEKTRLWSGFESSMKNLDAAATMPHWRAIYESALAEAHCLRGNLRLAEWRLNRSEKLAGITNSPWVKYRCAIIRARIAKNRGNDEQTLELAVLAESIANEHGWPNRAAHVRSEFQVELGKQKRRQSSEKSANVDSTAVAALQSQLDTLLAISRVSAEANDFKEMVDGVLSELLKTFVADRAFLFLSQKGHPAMELISGRDANGAELLEISGHSSTVIDNVRESRKPLVLAGTSEGALLGSESVVANDLRSIMAAPLVLKDTVLGVVYLDSRVTTGLFDQEDTRLLEGILNHMAVFIESSRQASRMRGLLEVSLASGAVLDTQTQARLALDEIIKIMGAQRGFLFLNGRADQSTSLDLAMARDDKRVDLQEEHGYASTIVAKTAQDQTPVLVTGNDRGELLDSKSAVMNDLRSIMAAPLKVQDRFIGVLYLDSQIARGGFTNDDVKLLVGIANHIAIAFDTARAAKIEVERRELLKDMEVSSGVQSLLLPKQSSIDSENLTFQSHFQPASQTGGDWWWHHHHPDGRHLIFVGDVTGHGAGSAMVTAIVAAIVRSRINDSRSFSVPELLKELNVHFCDMCDGKYWMTMAVVEIDPHSMSLKVWNAGAPPVLVVGKAGGAPKQICPLGSPLGIVGGEAGYHEESFSNDEMILIATDGLYELSLPTGRTLGERRVAKLLSDVQDWNPNAVSERIADKVAELLAGQAPPDDITWVVATKKPS